VSVVNDFVAGFGVRPGSVLVRLFTESAQVRIEGLSVVLDGRGEIARLAEYGISVRSRMRLVDWTADSAGVVCRLGEVNDWLRLLGMDSMKYSGHFIVNRGRIDRVTIHPEPESAEMLAGRLTEFWFWLMLNRPSGLSRLMPDGKLVPGRTDFSEVLHLLRQWRSGSR
jgi:hypothetical protein